MKKATLLIAMALMGLSPLPAQNSQTEKNISMYETVWDKVINHGQLGEINAQHFTEDVTMVTSPQNIVGIAAFRDYYQNFLTGFSNIKFTIVDVFGQGDKIAKHWRFQGINTGEFFGMPPTGKTVDVQGVTLVKMKDGRIAQEQDFIDPNILMQQLGLVSDPDNITVVDYMYKAFTSGDIPAVLARMDPNIVWNEAESNSLADGNPYLGPDAVLNGVFARLAADHEYFKLEDIKLHNMDNNQVLATLRYNAKVKKTGKTYNAQAEHLWTLKNGKVVAFQQFLDTKKVAEAMEN